MNVIIFGANGGIGQYAVKHAWAKGYNVTAYVRNPQKLIITNERLQVVKGEVSDYNTILNAMQGQDAVIWCVGIPMTNKYEKMESLEGHQNLLKAKQETGVKRLVDWGTPSVSYSGDAKSFITVVPCIMAGILFKKAKQEMVAIGDLLKESELDWTRVRFMAPKNSVYTGRVKVGFGDIKMNFAISREDIAAFIVEQLESKKYLYSMPIIGS